MSNIPNIGTQGTLGTNSSSSDTSNNISDPDTVNKNKADFANLEALRNKTASHNPITNDSRT